MQFTIFLYKLNQNSAKEGINTKNKTILFLLLVIAVLAISSCTKAECKVSADCPQKACSTQRCDSSKCVYSSTPNCCGNGDKDSLESGRPGNKCTCPQDYGSCEGKGKVKQGSQTVDAIYAHYYCTSSNECVMGVESKDAFPQNFPDSISAQYFKASSVMKYNKPFDMSRDAFELKITLDDANKDLVMPVKFNKVQVLLSTDYSRSELLIAEKNIDNDIPVIGNTVTINIPLNLDYRPQQVEETGTIRYVVDFSYNKRVVSSRKPDGSPVYDQELVREKFNSPSKQVFFVRSE